MLNDSPDPSVEPGSSSKAGPSKHKAPRSKAETPNAEGQTVSNKASSPQTPLNSTNAGGKPLARAVLVCKRCRSKKIKCDQAFPACGSCVKAGEPCIGVDSATGREVSRSYIVDLEHQVEELRRQNAELEQLLSDRSGSRSVDSAATSLKRPLEHVKQEFPLDPSESAEASMQEPPFKRLATTSNGTDRNAGADSASNNYVLPGLVLGPVGVEVLSSARPDQARTMRPLLGRLNSHASGLSPARLLCQAIQQSAQAGLRVRDPGSTSKLRSSNARNLGEALNGRSKNLFTKPTSSVGVSSMSHVASGHDRLEAPGSRLEVTPVSQGSGSVTPSDGKKNSPFDDGDPMQYATTTETGDITVPAPEQLLKPSPLPAPFPPLSVARKLVDAYFERVNPQLPILDRATFMPRFERACQIGLQRAKARRATGALDASGDDKDDEIEIEPQPADGHLFHLVFAIAAAMGWTRSNWSAENHHEAAMRFLDPRRLASNGQDGNVGAIMGRDALEQLQCLLLTALYSIMRPMKPGVWYCLGVALRLTTGLGLYTESPGLLEASHQGSTSDAAESLMEKKRRLFWCSYALDRQVCVHLGRPFGIADSDIKVNLPWVEDENEIVHIALSPEAANTGKLHSTDDVDSSNELARREAASTLAALQGSFDKRQRSSSRSGPVSLPKPRNASRWVSLSFFRMRILQSEIQSILYQNAELPRRFETYAHWKLDILKRLHAWRRYAPSSKQELEASGCGYNPIFLELNYQQTLLMIYGLSPRFPNASRKDLAHVEECSRSIINMYATLSKEGQMNYTWMTGHNVFLACTSYLYAIWQISATDPASFRSTMNLGFRNKVDEIHHFAAACDKVLASLQWATAEKCRKCLRTMFYATSMVVDKLDRMSAARTSGLAGTVTSETVKEDEVAGGKENTDWPTDAASMMLQTKVGTVSSKMPDAEIADSSGTSDKLPETVTVASWSLRAQSPDRRDSGQRHVQRNAETPQLGPPYWDRGSPRRPMKGSLEASTSSNTRTEQDQDDATGNRLDVHHLIHLSDQRGRREVQASDKAFGGDAATPSRGLDINTAVLDPPSSDSGWYGGWDPNASPKHLFPESPSNFDISSLMATSAMELDALFKEAGLSAGPGEQGAGGNQSSLNFSAHNEQGSWMAQPLPSSPRHENAPVSWSQAISHMQGGDDHYVASSMYSSSETPAGPSRTYMNAPHNNTSHFGASPTFEGESFETDWEALGLGYGMNAPSRVDQAHLNSQGHQLPFVGAVKSQLGIPPNAYSSGGQPSNTEFDRRFLDSHMGF